MSAQNRNLLGRTFVGTVVNNEHPKGLRFVRIRFPSIDDGAKDEDLPWSGIGRPLFRGGGNSVGIWSMPRVGSKVGGIFDNGARGSFVAFFELDDPSTTMEDWENDEWGVSDEEGTYVRVKVGETLEIHHMDAKVTIDADGNMKVFAKTIEYEAEEHTFKGPAVFEDDVAMNSNLEVAQEATISGIAFTPHVHGGVDTGGGQTQGPQ